VFQKSLNGGLWATDRVYMTSQRGRGTSDSVSAILRTRGQPSKGCELSQVRRCDGTPGARLCGRPRAYCNRIRATWCNAIVRRRMKLLRRPRLSSHIGTIGRTPRCRIVVDTLVPIGEVEPFTSRRIEPPLVFGIRRLRHVTHVRMEHWCAYAQRSAWVVCLSKAAGIRR
jgi:hypothetical protein